MNSEDLTKEQVFKNLHTFDACAGVYSEKVEWNYVVSKKVEENVLNPFLNELSDRRTPAGSKIAFMGCGTGRNIYITMLKSKYKCIGIDISSSMLNIAKSKLKGHSELIKSDVRTLSFEPASLSGIFAESVLSYLPKRDMERVVESFYSFLTFRGVLLLGYKVNGETVHKDTLLGSDRYYLTYSVSYLTKFLTKKGFEIINYRVSKDPLRENVQWCDFLLVK